MKGEGPFILIIIEFIASLIAKLVLSVKEYRKKQKLKKGSSEDGPSI